MDELKKLTDQLEYKFLKKIIEGLNNGSLTIEQAKEKAIIFLKLQPFTNIEDTKSKIRNFTSNYSQFTDLMNLMDSFHAEQKTNEIIGKMRSFIKEDRLDAALDVAKQTE